jgi:hypothetical protein
MLAVPGQGKGMKKKTGNRGPCDESMTTEQDGEQCCPVFFVFSHNSPDETPEGQVQAAVAKVLQQPQSTN